MAKRDDKGKNGKQASRADAVRAAVDQAFQATADQAEGTQRRVQEIADDLTQVAGRLREALDGARPVTVADVDAMREDIATLTTRVTALETAAKAAPAKAPAPRRAATRPAPKPTPTKVAAAAKSAATRKPAAPKTAASRSSTAASQVPAARAAARRSAAKRPD